MKAAYPSYLAARLDNGVDLISGDVRLIAMGDGYTYNAAHNFHDDLADIIATSGNLASKGNTNGIFTAADISLGSPAPGDEITRFALVRWTGTSGTSELVYYFDEDEAELPISISTDGTEKTVLWSGDGIFR